MTEPKKDLKVEHCPKCRQERSVREIAKDRYSDHSDPEYSHSNSAYFLQCETCHSYYVKLGHSNEHDVDHIWVSETGWELYCPERFTYLPAFAKRPFPNWFDRLKTEHHEVVSLLVDIYKASDNDLNQLAAMACRTLFEKLAAILKVGDALRFNEKLDKLRDDGHISTDHRDILEILVEGGHAAVHRDWSPEDDELVVILDILEEFIYTMLFKPSDDAKKKAQRDALLKALPPDTRKMKKTPAKAAPKPVVS